MTRLVISIRPEIGVPEINVILNGWEPVPYQINKALFKDKNLEIAPGDEAIIQKLLQISEVNISYEAAGFYLGSGEPRLLPYAENIWHIGLADPDESNWAIYEVCLKITVYDDLVSSNKSWCGISGCSVIYHFPENRNTACEQYVKMGLERRLQTTSETHDFRQVREWYTLPLFCLDDRGFLHASSEILKNYLAFNIQKKWKSFFAKALQISRSQRSCACFDITQKA